MNIDNLFSAAKKIQQDGEHGIHSAIKLVGRQNAVSMLIAHLQLTLNPNHIYPLDPAINKKIKEILEKEGLLEINLFRGEYRWASNFWMVDLEYGGYKGKSLEHLFQVFMTNDELTRQEIISCASAYEAKTISMRNDFPRREDYKETRLFLMEQLLALKFSVETQPELAYRLHLTDPMILKEGNNWGDTYFGICDGIGENNLGKSLMQRRSKNNEWFEEMMPTLKSTRPSSHQNSHWYKWQQMLGFYS